MQSRRNEKEIEPLDFFVIPTLKTQLLHMYYSTKLKAGKGSVLSDSVTVTLVPFLKKQLRDKRIIIDTVW